MNVISPDRSAAVHSDPDQTHTWTSESPLVAKHQLQPWRWGDGWAPWWHCQLQEGWLPTPRWKNSVGFPLMPYQQYEVFVLVHFNTLLPQKWVPVSCRVRTTLPETLISAAVVNLCPHLTAGHLPLSDNMQPDISNALSFVILPAPLLMNRH